MNKGIIIGISILAVAIIVIVIVVQSGKSRRAAEEAALRSASNNQGGGSGGFFGSLIDLGGGLAKNYISEQQAKKAANDKDGVDESGYAKGKGWINL